MRITLVLLLTAVMQLSAMNGYAQKTRVPISVSNISIEQVLNMIEENSDYVFLYNDQTIQKNRIVSVKNTSGNISDILNEVFRGTNVAYTIVDKQIILSTTKTDLVQQNPRINVNGIVRDAQGDPLIGVNIRVKSTDNGTVTDIEGRFSLSVEKGDILEFTYVGYLSVTVKVTDNQELKIELQEDQVMLDAVVVTALGIRKEAKALSYNVQELSGDEIVGVKDANFMNSLSGKIAGVIINSSSSGIGGGAKVVMRGAKSLSGNNNALYVIDGIPMPALETTQPSDHFTGMGQSGNGASMINPEDIENISVLSGAAASALYGSEAANGVIMITTKKGSAGKLRVNYANHTSFYNPFITPEFQNTYGATTGSLQSWGQKLAQPSSYDPMDFYQTGWNETNSLTISNGTDKNQTFLSLAATNAEGIVQNNTLDRYNVTIRNTTNMLNDKLRLDLNASYMNVRERNMVSQGQYFNPIVSTYLMSPSYSLETYKLFEMYDESRGFKTQYWPWGNMGLGMQNPYWITNRDNFINRKNRFLMSAGLNYEIAKGVTLGGRAKIDYTSAINEKKYSASTDAIFAGTYGAYYKDDYSTRQLYGDMMLNIDKYFGDFSVMATVGTSIQDVDYKYYSVGGDLNSVANSFTLKNLNQSKAKFDQDGYHDQTQSIFATAQVGWQSKLYLDVTGRIDWSSALAWTNTDYVAYPSVGLSAILTDLLPIKSDILPFLKLRGSYSEVGNAPTRYIAYQTYPYESGTPTTASTYPNTDIKPERTKAWEAGLQSRFWNDKIALNVSLYKTSTYNQLFNPALSASSGYTSIYINGGQVDNKGIEASLSIDQPIGPVKWNSTFTYTINRNKIKKLLNPTVLADGLTVEQDVLDLGGIGNVMTRLEEGGSIGDLFVTALRTDEHGYIDVDYVNNTVAVDNNAGDRKDGWIYAGNSQAKYTIGWRNSFSYKGITLGFLINARVGGVGVSMTQALMDAYGTSKASADARDAGGVVINGYLVPAAQKYYQTVGTGAGSMYVYSATNVRLGELTLGYDVPVRKYVSWLQGMNVAFTGRNLFMFYCKAPYDPELTASTGTHFSGMDYFMQPSLRNLGFSVKLNF
ncbi:TonB-linked SusC/RagA family outer membrane protein [Dysgonomonas hofstadii]|uniref:TonB-linked SusC/RagA family outer membrane protein n=1 Tax=Dysgonomonas hofstadii TaxID=637886 RepID=A0A840CVJ6_9BACT|nr:SusC/RagA family TonB-linked outer membrane protein [Dysgonomonas hofstadii]MBB4036502.1 TonB-linked SusC/RagA family outer membrane protein [Dysgonomonas hofstadii]